jgi:hypothetical protein
VRAELVDLAGLRLRFLRELRGLVGVAGGLDPGQQVLELSLGKAAQGELDAALSELGQQLRQRLLLPLAVGVVVAQRPEARPLALEADGDHRDRLPAELARRPQPLVAGNHRPVGEGEQGPSLQHLGVGGKRPLQLLEPLGPDRARVLRPAAQALERLLGERGDRRGRVGGTGGQLSGHHSHLQRRPSTKVDWRSSAMSSS